MEVESFRIKTCTLTVLSIINTSVSPLVNELRIDKKILPKFVHNLSSLLNLC